MKVFEILNIANYLFPNPWIFNVPQIMNFVFVLSIFTRVVFFQNLFETCFCTYVVYFTLEYWNQNSGWHGYSWIPNQEIKFFKRPLWMWTEEGFKLNFVTFQDFKSLFQSDIYVLNFWTEVFETVKNNKIFC